MKKLLLRKVSKTTIVLSLMISAGAIYAVGSNSTGFKSTTSYQTVNAHSSCKKIKHSGSTAYFVPTKTSTEWTAFRNNKPSGVSLAACYVNRPVAAMVQTRCDGSSNGKNLSSTFNVPTTGTYRLVFRMKRDDNQSYENIKVWVAGSYIFQSNDYYVGGNDVWKWVDSGVNKYLTAGNKNITIDHVYNDPNCSGHTGGPASVAIDYVRLQSL